MQSQLTLYQGQIVQFRDVSSVSKEIGVLLTGARVKPFSYSSFLVIREMFTYWNPRYECPDWGKMVCIYTFSQGFLNLEQ